MPACPSCGADVLDIDVKCGACGTNLSPTGAVRLVGTTVLMSSIAFSFQRFFEYQIEEGRRISQ